MKLLSPKAILMQLVLMGSAVPALANNALYPGYLDSVRDERFQKVEEMTLVPKPDTGPELKERIFDHRISREFKREYELKFGYTDAERNISAPSRYEEYEYSTGKTVSIEEDQENRRAFANYMLRRLGEHHLDNYAKSNPNVRPVYELKERIANVNVQMKQGYKLRFNYSYSGNFLDVRLENPYLTETKVSLRMDPNSFGPTKVQEQIFSVGRNFGPVGIYSKYYTEDGIVSLVGTKSITPRLSASLTGSTYTNDTGVSVRQKLVLVGLTWNE